MTHRNITDHQRLAHRFRGLNQPQEIGNMAAAFADGFSELGLA